MAGRLRFRLAVGGLSFVLALALLLGDRVSGSTLLGKLGAKPGPRPGAPSPAIDAGIDLREAGVTADFGGTSRPQGAAYDLGAFEFVPSNVPVLLGDDGARFGTAAAPSTPPTGRLFSIAPWGDDTNPGTVERPWASLHQVAQGIGHPGFPGPGDTVLIRGGTYHQAAIFPRGGAPGAPVTFRAYPGERPLFDGSMEISGGWRHVAGSVWAREFIRGPGLNNVAGHLDPAPVSTTPDGFAAGGDRSAFLYVDDTPDTDHWLRPYSLTDARDGLAGDPARLPARGFATTAPPPPQGERFYAGRTDIVYVNLGHLADPDPNHHRVRIPAHEHALLLWGPGPSHLAFQGLTFQLYPVGLDAYSRAEDVAVEGNEWRLFKQRVVNTYRCAPGWRVVGNWFHHYSYEAIHVESDRSLIEGNLMEETLIGYAPWGPGAINVLGNDNAVRKNVARHLRRQMSGNYSGGEPTPFALESWNLCGGKSAQRVVFEQNLAYDIEGSMFLLIGGDGAVLRNNLGYALRASGVVVLAGGTGGGLGAGDALSTRHRIFNNTFSDLGDVGIDLLKAARDIEIVNNILDRAARGPYRPHAGATYDRRANLDDGRDPRFANPDAGDFRLRGPVAIREQIAARSVPDGVRDARRIDLPARRAPLRVARGQRGWRADAVGRRWACRAG